MAFVPSPHQSSNGVGTREDWRKPSSFSSSLFFWFLLPCEEYQYLLPLLWLSFSIQQQHAIGTAPDCVTDTIRVWIAAIKLTMILLVSQCCCLTMLWTKVGSGAVDHRRQLHWLIFGLLQSQGFLKSWCLNPIEIANLPCTQLRLGSSSEIFKPWYYDLC